MKDIILPANYVKGAATPYEILQYGPGVNWLIRHKTQHNQICYDWGGAVAALFRGVQDGNQYKVAGMYLEFDNSGAPVDPTPTISRNTTPEYYRTLSGTADFLRVPLIATSGDNSDEDLFTANNIAIFHAQSVGSTGQRTTAPLTFSDAAGSRVYGAALVAFRDESDITQDLVISRIYFDVDNQVEKPASGQVGVTWSLTFE
jgi:hypothetical protein